MSDQPETLHTATVVAAAEEGDQRTSEESGEEIVEQAAAPAVADEEPPRAEMVAALEAILFVAGEPLARERLLEVFDAGERAEGERALRAVIARYQPAEGSGVMVEEVGGGIRLASRPELHGYLRRFFQLTGRTRLSMAALETLAIVAYRQPLTGPEMAELRGVQCNAVVKTLLERRLIRIVGRKQVVGKPFLYGTTREFLLHFGLGTLSDLPPLEELEDFFAAEGSGEVVPVDREEQLALESAELAEREGERDAALDAAEEDEHAAGSSFAEPVLADDNPDEVPAEAGVAERAE